MNHLFKGNSDRFDQCHKLCGVLNLVFLCLIDRELKEHHNQPTYDPLSQAERKA